MIVEKQSNLDKIVQGLESLVSMNDFEIECSQLKLSIQKHLELKLKELPHNTQYHLKDKCILSGGAISSLYYNESPKDYDLWCHDWVDIPEVTKSLTCIEDFVTSDTGEHYSGLSGPFYESPNAITLKNSVQFITLGDYYEQRKSFDFIHCMPYYVLKTGQFFISPNQWASIKNKKLVANNQKRLTDARIGKYVGKGWRN